MSKKPQIIFMGNMLCAQPKPKGHDVLVKEWAKHQAEINALNAYEGMGFFEKVWLEVTYLFRRKR